MNRQVIAVFDNVAKDIYGSIITLETHTANALRGFQQVLSNKDNNVGKFPNDFDLVCLGYIDPHTGHLVAHELEFDADGKPTRVKSLFEILIKGKDMKNMIDAQIAPAGPNLKVVGE